MMNIFKLKISWTTLSYLYRMETGKSYRLPNCTTIRV